MPTVTYYPEPEPTPVELSDAACEELKELGQKLGLRTWLWRVELVGFGMERVEFFLPAPGA